MNDVQFYRAKIDDSNYACVCLSQIRLSQKKYLIGDLAVAKDRIDMWNICTIIDILREHALVHFLQWEKVGLFVYINVATR